MRFKPEDIIELSHQLESDKENFKFHTVFKDVVELDPNAGHAAHRDDVWYIESEVVMHSHVGTHVELPFHHMENGPDAAQYPIENLIGEAVVLDCTGKKAGEAITLQEIRRYEDQLKPRDIVFFHTGFDQNFRTPNWEPFPYVEEEAINWLLKTINPRVIGTDASGIEVPGTDYQPNHTHCFENNTAIVESLTNLSAVNRMRTTVFILPLAIKRVDSCAVRIVAIKNL